MSLAPVSNRIWRLFVGVLPVIAGLLAYVLLAIPFFVLLDWRVPDYVWSPGTASTFGVVFVFSFAVHFLVSWSLALLVARLLSTSLTRTALATLVALLPLAYLGWGFLSLFASCSGIELPFAESASC